MTKNNKIMLFVPNLEGGGAERMAVNLVNAFANKGILVDLVLAREKGPYVKLIDKKVHVYNLRISFQNPLVILSLVKYMNKNKPNIIISLMTYSNIAVLIAYYFSKLSSQIIISERVTIGVQAKNSSHLKDWLKPYAARMLYSYADKIVAISNGVAKNLIETIGIQKEKVATIYNPVVTDLLISNHSKPKHPFFESKSKIILAAGRLVPEKDFKTLIYAFHELGTDAKLNLIILGEGPQYNELITLVRNLGLEAHISFPGYVENVYSYMQHSSVFVLSSMWEGFGNVLVEAMACGCPVVSTNCPGGPAEILSYGKFGHLVQPGDVNTLANAIHKTLQKPISSEVLRRRANEFRADVIADQYLELMLKK